jgi:23S rRNA (adenine2030-N6)-methyltransferase
MNYRHIYHAGNFADAHKHLILVMALNYLHQKEKGLFVLDAFAGIGLYDLNQPEPQKTGEYLAGIAKIMEQPAEHEDLVQFQKLVGLFWGGRQYAGSPVIAATLQRPQDRLVANELHPEDVETLRHHLRGFKNVKVTMDDAYQSIRAHIPPAERRGLILIDPPFEKPDEFEILVKQMDEWKKRWPTGCFAVWYPIKAGQPIRELHRAALNLGLNRTWVSEILLHPRERIGGLNGAGMLVFNTPFGLPEKMESLSDEFCKMLGQGQIENKYLINC